MLKIKLSKYGGKRSHSGRGKKGWYKGYYCDSSWELAYVIYNIDHNIKFERYKGYINYTYKDNNHKYYPDFKLEDGTLVEIKGYETDQWEAKRSECIKNHKLILINEQGIKTYIQYCIDKYGTNYIDLYDNSKPSKDYSRNKFLFMHKVGKNIVIKPEDINSYKQKGFVFGRL